MKKEKPKQKSDRLDGCGRLRQELQFKTNLDYTSETAPPPITPNCLFSNNQPLWTWSLVSAHVDEDGGLLSFSNMARLTQGLHDHPELKLQCDSLLCAGCQDGASMGAGGTWRQERPWLC